MKMASFFFWTTISYSQVIITITTFRQNIWQPKKCRLAQTQNDNRDTYSPLPFYLSNKLIFTVTSITAFFTSSSTRFSIYFSKDVLSDKWITFYTFHYMFQVTTLINTKTTTFRSHFFMHYRHFKTRRVIILRRWRLGSRLQFESQLNTVIEWKHIQSKAVHNRQLTSSAGNLFVNSRYSLEDHNFSFLQTDTCSATES